MERMKEIYSKKMQELGLTNDEVCSPEECEQFKKLTEDGKLLPEGVRRSSENDNIFLRTTHEDVSEKDVDKLLWLAMCKDISTLKKCVVFFVVILVIQLVLGIYFGLKIGAYFA